MAWKFSLILGNESPLREFFRLLSFDIQSPYLIASELIPEHLVSQIQIELVSLGIAPE